MAHTITPRQQQALDLIRAEGTVNHRRLAGEFGMRAQDAGRTLAALERAGLVYFHYGVGERTGYRLA